MDGAEQEAGDEGGGDGGAPILGEGMLDDAAEEEFLAVGNADVDAEEDGGDVEG